VTEAERAFYEWFHIWRQDNPHAPLDWVLASFMAGWMACMMREVEVK